MIRIGFACKWLPTSELEETSFRRTTVRWCLEHRGTAEGRINELVDSNCAALAALISKVSELPEALRMCRISSDLLPLFTHALGRELYSQELLLNVERKLAAIGASAKAAKILLSFHPGQFTVLNTPNENTLAASIAEVEMHAMLGAWLGYKGSKIDGFCINVHAGGAKSGLESLKHVIQHKLSPEARKMLTIENDEFSWSAQSLVSANLPVPIVLDVHHHWINTGTYIKPDEQLWHDVVATWEGARPKIHVAMSTQELVCAESRNSEGLPDLTKLLALKQTKSSLRAHSQTAWCERLVDYFLSFLPESNLMWEGKSKNLDANIIYQQAIKKGVICQST